MISIRYTVYRIFNFINELFFSYLRASLNKLNIEGVSNVQIVCVSLSGSTVGKLAHELVFSSPIEMTNLKICNCHNRYHS